MLSRFTLTYHAVIPPIFAFTRKTHEYNAMLLELCASADFRALNFSGNRKEGPVESNVIVIPESIIKIGKHWLISNVTVPSRIAERIVGRSVGQPMSRLHQNWRKGLPSRSERKSRREVKFQEPYCINPV